MPSLNRRRLLQTATAAALAAPLAPSRLAADPGPLDLAAVTRTLEVSGRAATVYGLRHGESHEGLFLTKGEDFRVRLTNRLTEETLVHWHGLTPPSHQDGTPGLSQPALPVGQAYDYDFPLDHAGTFWMHSHVGLQEQKLLAAPLIVRDPAEKGLDEQEVVLFLQDFSFRPPEEIFHDLKVGHGPGHGAGHMPGHVYGHGSVHSDPARTMGLSHSEMNHDEMHHGNGDHGTLHHGAMDHGAMDHGTMAGMVHYNDIAFDAYLANDRTLEDPEVVGVAPGGQLRLRIINAAAATNFLIDLGRLTGELIAVDGAGIVPLRGKLFDLAIAQRLDIRITLPKERAAFPILARREADRAQTGILLAAKDAPISKIPLLGVEGARPLNLALERRLQALAPLSPRPADRNILLRLTGYHGTYDWGFDGAGYDPGNPILVQEGERVTVTMRNETMMPHPMHLHGHRFQVVTLEGKALAGALRDTVLVPPRQEVTIAFDADNPGHWAFHCHQLYHMAAGMMTSLRYEGFF